MTPCFLNRCALSPASPRPTTVKADTGVDDTLHRCMPHHALANETATERNRIAMTQYDPA